MIVLGLDVPGSGVSGTGGYAVLDIDGKIARVLDRKDILFAETKSERMHYRQLGMLLDRIYRDYQFALIGIERPFLYRIAQVVGGAKMWAARKQGMLWYMFGSSQARKVGLGNGGLSKEQVLTRMSRRFGGRGMSQHQADAVLYAIAAEALHRGNHDKK